MAERTRPSSEWYRRKIVTMGDHDYLIGPQIDLQSEQAEYGVIATILAFGALVRLERRNSKLTVAELAKALDVEEDEIRSIEHNPQYRARPRTILGIAKYFKLPPKEVMKLAGAAASNDEKFAEKAMRFAAHSDDLGTLTDEEKKLLCSFVEFLNKN